MANPVSWLKAANIHLYTSPYILSHQVISVGLNIRMFVIAAVALGMFVAFAVTLSNAVSDSDAKAIKSGCSRVCVKQGWKCIGPMTVCTKTGCVKTCESYQLGCVKYGAYVCSVN